MIALFSVTFLFCGLVLLVFRPYWGFCLIMATKPIIDASWNASIGGVNTLRILGFALPVLLLPRLLSSSFWKRPENRWWFYLGALYFISLISGMVLFPTANDPVLTLNISFRYINGFLAFLMIPCFATTEKRLKQILIAFIIAGLFPMIVGIIQVITGLEFVDSRQTNGLQRNTGFYHSAVSVRQFGLETLLVILLYLHFFTPRLFIVKASLIAYALLWLVVLYFAYVRGAYVVLALWSLVWTVGFRKLQYTILATALVAGLVAVSSINIEEQVGQLFIKEISFAEGGFTDRSRVLNGRFNLWQHAYYTWLEGSLMNKIWGTGLYYSSHNELIGILLRGGIFGVVTYILFFMILYIKTALFFLNSGTHSKLAVYSVMILVMYGVSSLAGTPSATPQYQWFIFGFLGTFILNKERLSALSECQKQTHKFQLTYRSKYH